MTEGGESAGRTTVEDQVDELTQHMSKMSVGGDEEAAVDGGGQEEGADDPLPPQVPPPTLDDTRQELIMIDWKRTKRVKHKDYERQLNLYRYLLEKNYREFRVTEMYIVRLHPNTETYDLCKVLINDDIVKAALGLQAHIR